MGAITEAIGKFLDETSNNWGSFLAALTGIGFLSMAIVETLKNMFPLRNWFHRRSLDNWLRTHYEIARRRFSGIKRKVSLSDAKADLLRLSVNGNGKALYDLPIEQLCGQLNAAIRVALDYPQEAEHFSLLAVAAAQASPEDLELMVKEPPAPVADPEALTAAQMKSRSKYIDARNRVTHQTQRAIDAFQISTGYRWKLWLQIASFAVPVLMVFIALSGDRDIGGGALLLTALAAGFIAPVAHDVVVIIQRLKRG